MRLLLAVLVAVAGALVPMSRAGAQDRDVRFEITAVGDTTVNFRVGKMTWVVRSPRAMVVDPRRRGERVASLKVLSVSSTGEAMAIVTGQRSRITADHVVLIEEPPSRWYRNTGLWFGAALGLAAGFGLGKM